jgi:uncharacterized protein YllA (UPF0747 family)
MTAPRVITEELGGSPLARAAQRGALPQWYLRRPPDAAAWREYVGGVAREYAGGAWLDTLLPALAPRGEARRRLQRAAEQDGVVVTTGQQAALFGGPLYTLVKALSALAVADAVERETGVHAAPVFWAATDDADFREAACARVAVADGVRALCVPPPVRDGIPMSLVPLGDVAPLVDALAEACGSVADDVPLAAVRTSHAPGATVGSAYVELLRALLEPLGVSVLDASHAAVRAAGGATVTRALDRAAAVEEALQARTAEITALGYRPQVDLVPGLSLVFGADTDGVKYRLPVAQSGNAGRRVAASSLSPNVLLRPVMERAMMPAAAYVAGPGEIAYFAQTSPVAEALGIATPLALPRWSATIVEPRIERLLDRLGIAREALAAPDAIESQLAREAIPAKVAAALARLRADVDADVAALAAADDTGLVPASSLEGLRRRILARLERMERRYAAGIKRREAQLMRDVATARAALYPGGERQERVLNFIPFLARNGRPLLDAMRAEAARHADRLIGSRTAHGSGGAVAERV